MGIGAVVLDLCRAAVRGDMSSMAGRLSRSFTALLLVATLPPPAAGQDSIAGAATAQGIGLPDSLPAAVRGRLQAALDDAERHPADATAAGRVGMLLHAYGQYLLASQAYDRAADLNPGTLAWPYLAGVACAEAGESLRAAGHFRRALAIDKGYLAARLRLGDALLASGDLPRAREEYEALVVAFPELALAEYGLGRVLAAQGDDKSAAVHYGRAVTLSPQFGRAHYALALLLRDAGAAGTAERHLESYRRYGASRPAIPDPLVDEVQSMADTSRELLARAARLGASGRTDEAIALHLQALAADPAATQAHVNLIALYGRAGRAEDAERHYRAALRLGSNLAEAHYNFGVLQASLGRLEAAAESFRRTIEADPFHSRAHNNLAALLAQRGDREQAVAEYRQALAGDPQHTAARFRLAQLLVSLGRPREAVTELELLVRLGDGDEPRYGHALALAWLAAGERAQAIAAGRRALRTAERLGQTDLVRSIQRDLARMNPPG